MIFQARFCSGIEFRKYFRLAGTRKRTDHLSYLAVADQGGQARRHLEQASGQVSQKQGYRDADRYQNEGLATGGGHVLHVICDLSIASENAVFGQTGPKVGSFDGGYGATMLARIVGHKKAREIWYLCRQYSAAEALDMGLVNTVVPLERLEDEGVQWAHEILEKSPTAIRMLKRSFNADVDGLAGIQELAGDATMLFYQTEEAHEGSKAFLEKRRPRWAQ